MQVVNEKNSDDDIQFLCVDDEARVHRVSISDKKTKQPQSNGKILRDNHLFMMHLKY